MNLAAAIERMEAAGMSSQDILTAVKCFAPEIVPPADIAIEKRREADRERQARYRASKDRNVTNVTNVTSPSPLVPPLSPAPLTPPIIPPTQIGFGLDAGRELETKLREAAGWQNEPAPMLAVTGEIEALLGQGASLELDVLPIIKALGSQPKRRSSWKYFIGPIRDQWQARISTEATGPPVAQVVPFSQPHSGVFRAADQPKHSRNQTISMLRAGVAELKRREAGEGGERLRVIDEGTP